MESGGRVDPAVVLVGSVVGGGGAFGASRGEVMMMPAQLAPDPPLLEGPANNSPNKPWRMQDHAATSRFPTRSSLRIRTTR